MPIGRTPRLPLLDERVSQLLTHQQQHLDSLQLVMRNGQIEVPQDRGSKYLRITLGDEGFNLTKDPIVKQKQVQETPRFHNELHKVIPTKPRSQRTLVNSLRLLQGSAVFISGRPQQQPTETIAGVPVDAEEVKGLLLLA